MVSDARIRINGHRLVPGQDAPTHEARISAQRTTLEEYRQLSRRTVHHRSILHAVIFAVAFIFTAGAALLGVLLWVRPDGFTSLVFVGVFSALVFVASFSALRFLSVVHLFPERHLTDSGEEEHHLAKSIAYGFVALVFALLLAGLLINVATAFTL